MAQGIGAAGDYYRLRLTHLDTIDGPDFEWREDILYRRPEKQAPAEGEIFRVEAVSLDDAEDMTALGSFDSRDDAYEAFAAAGEDLAELTRSEFEDRYFPAES
jgi:hypothetical protein